MAASKWVIYDAAKLAMLNGTLDLDDATAGAFKMALFTDASDAETVGAANTFISDLTNEHSTTNTGYARASLSTVSLTEPTPGTIRWTFTTNPVFSASGGGGGIVAKYAVIFRDTGTPTTSRLVCYCDLETTNATGVSVTDGNTLTVEFNATNGIFELSGARSEV